MAQRGPSPNYDKSPDDARDAAQNDAIERSLPHLTEHFDTVQLFLTSWDEETKNLRCMVLGHGNLLARLKHVEDWADMMESRLPDMDMGDEGMGGQDEDEDDDDSTGTTKGL